MPLAPSTNMMIVAVSLSVLQGLASWVPVALQLEDHIVSPYVSRNACVQGNSLELGTGSQLAISRAYLGSLQAPRLDTASSQASLLDRQ
jgi:hypothetical protein